LKIERRGKRGRGVGIGEIGRKSRRHGGSEKEGDPSR